MTVRATPALEHVTVLANERVCAGVGLLSLHAPRCAVDVLPGQFVHLRLGTERDLLLRRPFSVWRTAEERIEILYQVVGEGTRRLADVAPGSPGVDIIGPVGRGWDVPDHATHALVIAAGLGSAPLGMLVDRLAERGVAVSVAVGAPTAERLLCVDDFERVARRVEIATDDGTRGRKALVPELSAAMLAEDDYDIVYVCGPEIVQKLVAEQAAGAGVACQVSLERRMACGIGACLSCIVSTTSGQKRACVDGPVFDAAEVVWK